MQRLSAFRAKAELELEIPVAAATAVRRSALGGAPRRPAGIFRARLRVGRFAAFTGQRRGAFRKAPGQGVPGKLRFLPLEQGVLDNPAPEAGTPAGQFRLVIPSRRLRVSPTRTPSEGVLLPDAPWKGLPAVQISVPLVRTSAADTFTGFIAASRQEAKPRVDLFGPVEGPFLAFLGDCC
ncbi:MAG: hypothetical protein IPN71_09695 [Fibrobacteres bacterium]|nr:hypothetical protein [Fibrobacterota bacterium]